MKHILLKKASVFLLVTFGTMILYPDSSSAANYKDDLNRIKKLYDIGDYYEAQKVINEFLQEHKDKDNDNAKPYLCEAYHYQAKMYFDFNETSEAKESLKGLFKVDPDYQFTGEEDQKFLEFAEVVRKKIKSASEASSPKNKNSIKEPKVEEKKTEQKVPSQPGPDTDPKGEPGIKGNGKKEKGGAIEMEGQKRKKKNLPPLVIVAGAVVLGAILYFVLKSKNNDNMAGILSTVFKFENLPEEELVVQKGMPNDRITEYYDNPQNIKSVSMFKLEMNLQGLDIWEAPILDFKIKFNESDSWKIDSSIKDGKLQCVKKLSSPIGNPKGNWTVMIENNAYRKASFRVSMCKITFYYSPTP
jgi:tetratricopeptide (TPR) repeat protein